MNTHVVSDIGLYELSQHCGFALGRDRDRVDYVPEQSEDGSGELACTMDELSTEIAESFQAFEGHMKDYDNALDSLQVSANSMSLSVTESNVQDTATDLGTEMDIGSKLRVCESLATSGASRL